MLIISQKLSGLPDMLNYRVISIMPALGNAW